MTRKDYIEIAKALRLAKPSRPVSGDTFTSTARNVWVGGRRAWADCVITVSDALHRDNPRFDYDRFYDACAFGINHEPLGFGFDQIT